jgi:GTP-binding protein
MEIRNIAIIAHVDHGKTTLTDALMQQSGMAELGFTMDTNKLEQERGITIYAKNTSIFYKDTKINIVDTPGHADFGSEVERVLRSIDTVLLVVDAQEGPMPQTRFVLKKSLELGLKPIVVINKIDKPAANPEKAHEEVLELFMELGANNEQLDFSTIYAIGRQGVAFKTIEEVKKSMSRSDSPSSGESTTGNLNPLLDLILEKVPPASSDTTKPLSAQIFNLGYDNFMGRLAIARIYSGKINNLSQIFIKDETGATRQKKITKLFTFYGMTKKEVDEAVAGDIVMIAGINDAYIGETITDNVDEPALSSINIDEPTISLNFVINDSPFAGREGKFVTSRQIRERLEKELEINVGLRVDFDDVDGFKVFGRGELHIAILIENMRREGFELQISQPHVIIKNVNGVDHEPFEELTIDVPEVYSGTVIEQINKRRGIMTNMKIHERQARVVFEIPTRGLLGYRGQFIIDTKGEGIICSRVIGFKPFVGEIKKKETGSMISMASGKALAFALWGLQDRGVIYIEPGTEVYEGMIVGNTSKGEEMEVNPTKGKVQSNVRQTCSDEAIYLTPPFKLSIERGMEIMANTEYLEITPESVRLRSKYLTKNDRIRSERKVQGNI